MSWQQAGRKDLPTVLDFLLRQEALCVPFTSRLRTGARGCDVYFDRDAAGAVAECILFTTSGLLLPVLSASRESHAALADILLAARTMVHSIMGVGSCVAIAESLLPLPPTTRIEYFLMTLARSSLRAPLPIDAPYMRVRKADPYDAEEIFPLQRGYELEEVVITPSHFNDAQCMKMLKAALREQLVYILETDGTAVAKAGTNARGFGADQIGGVYTLPPQRGKGFGRVVVGELLKAVFSEKKDACLFVKKHNRPALALYERLGFTPVTDYFISYYGI